MTVGDKSSASNGDASGPRATRADALPEPALQSRPEVTPAIAVLELRRQVAAQCDAVRHMASAIAHIHSDYAKVFADPGCKVDELVDIVGDRTAAFMETLGDMLNGMDACAEEDEWLTPVFEEAQRLWPQSQDSAQGIETDRPRLGTGLGAKPESPVGSADAPIPDHSEVR